MKTIIHETYKARQPNKLYKSRKEKQHFLTIKRVKSKRLTSLIRIIAANPQKVYLKNKIPKIIETLR